MKKKPGELALVFGIGAVLYSFTEILWRGYTHWTMSLTGGFCFLIMYFVNVKTKIRNIFGRCAICAVAVTVVEFSVGCVVNLALDWNVWDYSLSKFNILGQVCPLYSFFWFLLGFPANFVCRKIKKLIFG